MLQTGTNFGPTPTNQKTSYSLGKTPIISKSKLMPKGGNMQQQMQINLINSKIEDIIEQQYQSMKQKNRF